MAVATSWFSLCKSRQWRNQMLSGQTQAPRLTHSPKWWRSWDLQVPRKGLKLFVSEHITGFLGSVTLSGATVAEGRGAFSMATLESPHLSNACFGLWIHFLEPWKQVPAEVRTAWLWDIPRIHFVLLAHFSCEDPREVTESKIPFSSEWLWLIQLLAFQASHSIFETTPSVRKILKIRRLRLPVQHVG